MSYLESGMFASSEDRIEDHHCRKCGDIATVRVIYLWYLSKYYCKTCMPELSKDDGGGFFDD